MWRKKRENFTRRRCWWSKRRNEKGVKDSETNKREKEMDTEKGGIFKEKHPYKKQREKKERAQGLPFIRSSLPIIDYQI